jgi:hypothetical protein
LIKQYIKGFKELSKELNKDPVEIYKTLPNKIIDFLKKIGIDLTKQFLFKATTILLLIFYITYIGGVDGYIIDILKILYSGIKMSMYIVVTISVVLIGLIVFKEDYLRFKAFIIGSDYRW